MAKGAREVVGLTCEVCKSQNYVTTRNKTNLQVKKDTQKLSIKKFCANCGKVTLHKEKSKLK